MGKPSNDTHDIINKYNPTVAPQYEEKIQETKKQAFQVLAAGQLAIVKAKCNEAIANKQLTILTSDTEVQEAFDNLRKDYLDTTLDPIIAATENTNITDEQFFQNAKIITDKLIQLICTEYEKEDITPVYIRRAGLFPFMQTCIESGIQTHEHIGLCRRENKPEQQDIYLPLTLHTKALHKDSKILLADPMLATGGSLSTVIKLLLGAGIQEDQIFIASVISAPEGLYKVLTEYPQIKIYTGTLDDHLNEKAFIQPGLGDFGDKVSKYIKLAYLEYLKPYFKKSRIFELLKTKLKLVA